jgi:hypothetical protein
LDNFKKEYIELFKNVLLGAHYEESSWSRIYDNKKKLFSWPLSFQFLRDIIVRNFQKRSIILFKQKTHDSQKAIDGKGTSGPRYTAVSKKRLDNIEFCINKILENDIKGDFIETGVWRGGSCIFMRELLRINKVTDKKVFVADSFEGMPIPKDKYDGPDHSMFESAKVSLEQIKSNFKTFNFDEDEQVVFIKGWFSESLPKANIKKLSLLRLDGDLYSSTMDSLNNLYNKVSKGGYVIVDDYNDWPECKKAVLDFRDKHSITSEIKNIDWTGIYWKVE